jgi:hypothetical protein
MRPSQLPHKLIRGDANNVTPSHFKDSPNGEGRGLPASESLLDLWGLYSSAAREYVRMRLCDFSLRCFEQTVRLPSNATAMLPKTFIAAVGANYPARSVFEKFGEKARREVGTGTSSPPDMIATWKPLTHLFLCCWPGMRVSKAPLLVESGLVLRVFVALSAKQLKL